MSRSLAAGALAGIRVIDLSHQAAGSWCTSLLGDTGADVVKVENPGRRDRFESLNKRGTTIDIGQEADVARRAGWCARPTCRRRASAPASWI